MKKLLCMALCLILALSLCACGGNDPDTSTETGTQNPSGKDTTVDIGKENTGKSTFFDENGILIRQEPVIQKYELENVDTFKDEYVEANITSVEVTAQDVVIIYTVKNLSEYTLACNAMSCELSGYTIAIDTQKNDTITEAIAPDATVERKVTLDKTLLGDSDLKYILNGALNVGFSAHYMNEDYLDYHGRGTLAFETKCEEINKPYTEGAVAYDKDGVKIVVQYTGWCQGKIDLLDSRIRLVRIFVTNNTEENRRVEFTEVLVNGKEELSIYPNKIYSHRVSVNAGTSACYVFDARNTSDVRTALTTEKMENFKVSLELQNEYSGNGIPVEATVETKR